MKLNLRGEQRRHIILMRQLEEQVVEPMHVAVTLHQEQRRDPSVDQPPAAPQAFRPPSIVHVLVISAHVVMTVLRARVHVRARLDGWRAGGCSEGGAVLDAVLLKLFAHPR